LTKNSTMFTTKAAEILNYNDKLYQVYRRININRIKEGHINDVKELWHCDLVLKNKNQDQEILIFLVEISDVVIVEDIPSPTPAAIVVT
jgi:hypothetical protein